MMKLVLGLCLLSGVGLSHSWLECADYRGPTTTFKHGDYKVENCKGFPRPLDGGNRGVGRQEFGQDIGMDKQTTRSDAAAQCHTGRVANYGTEFPKATYKAGATYTLAWPAKNHAAAACTSPFIPDTALKVFASGVNPTEDPVHSEFQKNQIKASFSDDPHVNGQIDMKGFQKCPDFCANTDRAFCYGTITLPEDMQAGEYTFQWYWEFNQGQIYMTCFDVVVSADADVPAAPGQPTEPTASPVSGPAPAPEKPGMGPQRPGQGPQPPSSQCGAIPGTNSIEIVSVPKSLPANSPSFTVSLCYTATKRLHIVAELVHAESDTEIAHMGYGSQQVDPVLGRAVTFTMLVQIDKPLTEDMDDVWIRVWNADSDKFREWESDRKKTPISAYELSRRQSPVSVTVATSGANMLNAWAFVSVQVVLTALWLQF